MKTSALSFILCSALGIILTPTAYPAPAEAPAKAFRVRAIEQRDMPVVEPGASEFTVRRVLGEPWRKLNSDTWVYERYTASNWKIDTGNCSTLIISFAKGEVVELKLVNGRAEKAIAAGLQKNPLPANVAKN
jgi:hypothetical protein